MTSPIRQTLSTHLGKVLTPEIAAEIEQAAFSCSHPDPMLRFMQGNKEATQWCNDLIRVADVWDNLIDCDVNVSKSDIDDLCEKSLLSMSCNSFFQKHADELAPIMRSSIRNWKIANAMSFRSPESRIQSHVLRYSAIDAIVACAAIVGGDEWAVEVGPALRERHMQDSLLHYLQELASRDYDIETDEYIKHGCRIFESCLLADTDQGHVSKLYEIIAPNSGDLIGDFGCGIGEVSRLMSELDDSLNFFLVTNSKRQIDLLPNGSQFIHYFGDFSEKSAPDESLDVAMFNQSIGYADLDKTLMSVFKALKPGGKLAILDFVSNGSLNPENLNWGYASNNEAAFMKCLGNAGFVDVSITHPKFVKNEKFVGLFDNSQCMKNLHQSLQSSSNGALIKARKP